MTQRRTDQEAWLMRAQREELVGRIARAIPDDGAVQPLQGLHLNRVSSPTEPLYGVSTPSFCVIAQGSKEVLLGEDLDAASVATRVGYNDAAHFNRAYKSLFGVPPMRDVARLRETAGAVTS